MPWVAYTSNGLLSANKLRLELAVQVQDAHAMTSLGHQRTNARSPLMEPRQEPLLVTRSACLWANWRHQRDQVPFRGIPAKFQMQTTQSYHRRRRLYFQVWRCRPPWGHCSIRLWTLMPSWVSALWALMIPAMLKAPILPQVLRSLMILRTGIMAPPPVLLKSPVPPQVLRSPMTHKDPMEGSLVGTS